MDPFWRGGATETWRGATETWRGGTEIWRGAAETWRRGEEEKAGLSSSSFVNE